MNGDLTIENFELGVCVEQGGWPFENLEVFDNMKNAATVSDLPIRGTALIAWAEAAWDGKNVKVSCRCESSGNLKGEIAGGHQRVPVVRWSVKDGSPLRSARVPWADAEPQPSVVKLVCNHQTMTVVVFDERPLQEREDTLPPEVDKELGQIMRDELLFEQYGGQIAEDGANPDTAIDGLDEFSPEPSATSEEVVQESTTSHVESYRRARLRYRQETLPRGRQLGQTGDPRGKPQHWDLRATNTSTGWRVANRSVQAAGSA